MTGLELFLLSTTLVASARWLMERHFCRVWEKITVGANRTSEEAIRNTEAALGLLDRNRKLTDRIVVAASRHRLLSRGIDPRRDALWGDS